MVLCAGISCCRSLRSPRSESDSESEEPTESEASESAAAAMLILGGSNSAQDGSGVNSGVYWYPAGSGHISDYRDAGANAAFGGTAG